MIVVLLVGYLIARVAGRLATAICEKIGLQMAAERSGLVESMQQVGIRRSIPSIVGLMFFWLLMCVFLTAGFNILGWEGISSGMETIVAYIPKLLVATVVVVIGLLIATFLRGVIATSADRAGISYAQQLASGCYYILALMIFMAAFDQLEIKFDCSTMPFSSLLPRWQLASDFHSVLADGMWLEASWLAIMYGSEWRPAIMSASGT